VLVKIIHDIDGLEEMATEWRELAGHSVEENINYEPEPFISLIRNIDYKGWFVVCIWEEEKLLGFFPMQSVKRIPLKIEQFSSLFKNHLMAALPLVHKNYQEQTIKEFFSWLNSGIPKLFYFSELLPTSALGNRILEIGKQCSASVLLSYKTTRAIAYKARSDRRSKLRKIEKLGGWETKFTSTGEVEIKKDIATLVEVEGKSWKTENKSAIHTQPGVQEYITDLALYAASKNRLLLSTAYIGGKAAAAAFCLVNDAKLLIYKIGYDEEFSKFTVGQNMLLALIEHSMHDARIRCVDSCGAPDSEMYNRIMSGVEDIHEYQIASNHILSKTSLIGIAKTRAARAKIKGVLSKSNA